MSVRDFYEGRLAVQVDASRSMTVEDMHEALDFDLLESSHTFIQWLFPTDDRSRFNRQAALLVADDARRIACNLCTALRVRESFLLMLEFIGFGMRPDGSLVQTDDDRLRHFESHRHNWLRVSRMLRSLVLLGCTHYARALFEALSFEVDHGRLSACRLSRDSFWRASAYDERPPGFPDSTCLHRYEGLTPSRQVGHLCAIVRSLRCLGAQRALRRHTTSSCVIVGLLSSKKVCVLTPSRIQVVVVSKMRRRVVRMQAVNKREALFGFAVYKAVRQSVAYLGDGALCEFPLP